MKNIRLIIVEDDEALRKSLCDWLSKEYIVTSFDSAETLLAFLKINNLDDGIKTCLLLDFQMPGMNGVELQATLRKMNIKFPIVFTSGNAKQGDIIDAWHGGAIDFILKPFTGAKVSETLRSLFNPSVTSVISDSSFANQNESVLIPISQREAQVLLLLGKGYKQHEIANMLNITLRTVKWHRASIKNKLGLDTLIQIARYCDLHMPSIKKIFANDG
jgi:FixJ family two-component response regulator